ncbi:MAG: hypothetical protein ACYCZH_07025 [Sulfuriferula sp.]
MDKAESTHQQKARTVNFAVSDGLYQLKADASQGDIIDHLNGRLCQLSAMLTMTRGAGQEGFSIWSDVIKNDYLWAASMIADECKELALHL